MSQKERPPNFKYVPTTAAELADELRWQALWGFLERSVKRRRVLVLDTYRWDDWAVFESVIKSEFGCGGCGVRYEVYDVAGVTWCRDDPVRHACWAMIDRHICVCPREARREDDPPRKKWDFADDCWNCDGGDYDANCQHFRGGIEVPTRCIVNNVVDVDLWTHLHEPTLADRCLRRAVNSIPFVWERCVWLNLPAQPPFRMDPNHYSSLVRYAQAVLEEARPILPEEVYSKFFWLAHRNIHEHHAKPLRK